VPKAEDTFLSTSQAAAILGVSRQRVVQLVYQGRLKANKVGNMYIIRKADLAEVANRKPGRPTKKSRKK
jgi:excisionase family DNA binding protein